MRALNFISNDERWNRMKLTSYLAGIAAVVVLISGIPGSSHAMTAREIMKKYTDQFSVADETDKANMALINKQGKRRSRALTIMSKEYPGNLHKILIRFTSPESIYGAGLLIAEQRNRSDDEWLYLPALKKIKKISTSERSHSFMGSEFSYEDLHREVLDDFAYELKGSEAVHGQDCFLIEATPASQRKLAETGYSKRILWIRKDIFFKVKAAYFDKKGKPLKMEADEVLTEISPGKYRMNRITMMNVKTEKKTVLESTSRSINKGIPSTRFTATYLEQGA